jgi:hypothetical protein
MTKEQAGRIKTLPENDMHRIAQDYDSGVAPAAAPDAAGPHTLASPPCERISSLSC